MKKYKNVKADIRTSGYAKVLNSADEMFEELGYKLVTELDHTLEYKKQLENYSKFIKFDLLDKEFTTFNYVVTDIQSYITMQELQAINEKVKELGWNE